MPRLDHNPAVSLRLVDDQVRRPPADARRDQPDELGAIRVRQRLAEDRSSQVPDVRDDQRNATFQ